MITIDIDHFSSRVLQDCLTEATAQYWERRSETFEAAAPQPEDFYGQASATELSAARERCLATAAACRRRAQLARSGLDDALSMAEVTRMLEAVG